MILAFLALLGTSLSPASSVLLGGEYRQGAGRDSLIYVADGRGVRVFQAKTFKPMGEAMISGRVEHVALQAGNLYLGGTRGIARVTVPDLLEGKPEKDMIWEGSVEGMAADSGGLWFSDDLGNLYTLDSTENPLRLEVTLPIPHSLILKEGILYAAADTAGLYAYHIEEGELEEMEVEGSPPVMDVCFGQGKVYLACAEQGLWVAEPKRNRLKVINRIAVSGELMEVELFGNRLAAAAGTGDFKVFSLKDPQAPNLVQAERLPGASLGLLKAGTDCYVFTGSGIGHMDFSTSPLAGHGLYFRGEGTSYDVDIHGDIAVLAGGEAGVMTVNLGPASRLLGTYSAMPPARRVYLYGAEVYALTAANLMQVVNLKDASHPAKGTFLQFESVTTGIDSQGEMLLAAEGERGVGIWWRCPCGPFKEQGRYSFAGKATDVQIRERLAFVSGDPAGIEVIDWADSTRPEMIAELQLPGSCERLYLSDDLLFGLDAEGGLAIADVRRASRPGLLSWVDIEGTPNDLAREADELYISCGDAGVCLVDISDPRSPKVSRMEDISPATGIGITRDLVVVGTPYSVETYNIQREGE